MVRFKLFYQKFRIFHLNDDRIQTEIRKVKVSISVLAISFLKKKIFKVKFNFAIISRPRGVMGVMGIIGQFSDKLF